MFKKLNTYTQFFKTIAKLAIPITIGQLGLVLMGFADIVMLGRYDTLAMSAAGVGNAVFFLFALIGIGTQYATSTLISIADGEGKSQQSIPIYKSSLWVTFVLSAVLMLVNVFFYYNFDVFGQTPDLTKSAKEYLWIINFSVPALLLFNCGKQVLDGLGKPNQSMIVTFIGLILNVILNDLFIYGHGGFPEMGLAGAAWASLSSRYLMALLMLLWVQFHPIIIHLKTKSIEAKSYFINILKIGLPIGFTYFFEIAAFSYALILAGRISELHSGAHQIAINLASITYMFVMGISAACNIVVGNHYGAKDQKGVRRSGFAAILLTIAIEGFFAIIFLIFNKDLPLIYTVDPILLEITPMLLVLSAFFQVSDGLQAVAAGALRGIKDTKVTGIIAFVSYWLIMMPGAYFLCFNLEMGINGIWLSFIIGLSFAAILLLYRFNTKTKLGRLKFDETDPMHSMVDI
ncbi:MAG: MATE family efflux transporter [Bacteroidia bacterium]